MLGAMHDVSTGKVKFYEWLLSSGFIEKERYKAFVEIGTLGTKGCINYYGFIGIIAMKKNFILAISTIALLLWINYFAEELSHLFRKIEDQYIFHMVYSFVFLLVSTLIFFFFSKIRKFHTKIFICVIGALATQIIAVAILYFINFGNLGDIGVIMNLGLGAILNWVPIAIIWYFTLERFYKAS